MCVINDICGYTQELALSNHSIQSFALFTTTFSQGFVMVNAGFTFIGIVSLITFIRYFFSEN